MIRLDSISKEFYLKPGCRVLHVGKSIVLFVDRKPFLKYSLDSFDSVLPLSGFYHGYSVALGTIAKFLKSDMDYYPHALQGVILRYFKYINHIRRQLELGGIR